MVGDVDLVSLFFYSVDKIFWDTNRNRAAGWLKVGERGLLKIAWFKVLTKIDFRPKFLLLSSVFKLGEFEWFFHFYIYFSNLYSFLLSFLADIILILLSLVVKATNNFLLVVVEPKITCLFSPFECRGSLSSFLF